MNKIEAKATKGNKENVDDAGPPMSLLSLSLAQFGDQSRSDAVPLPRLLRSLPGKNAETIDREQPTREPPLNLSIDLTRDFPKTTSETGEIPNFDAAIHSNILSRDRTLSFSAQRQENHLGASSPLTSCSYQTMSKVYDMDTWRMYHRIQSARSQESSDVSHPRNLEDENDDEHRNNIETPESRRDYMQPPQLTPVGYGEELFDLEL